MKRKIILHLKKIHSHNNKFNNKEFKMVRNPKIKNRRIMKGNNNKNNKIIKIINDKTHLIPK